MNAYRTEIFAFVAEDVYTFKDFDEWMEKGELFFKAYKMVSDTPTKWIWSR